MVPTTKGAPQLAKEVFLIVIEQVTVLPLITTLGVLNVAHPADVFAVKLPVFWREHVPFPFAYICPYELRKFVACRSASAWLTVDVKE
jgi:hypothetical protein